MNFFLKNQKPRNVPRQKLAPEILHPVLSRTRLNIFASRSALVNIRYGDARFSRKRTLLKGPFFPRIKLCFSCLQADHMFRNCPKAWKCSEPECESTHNFLSPGADSIHPPRKEENNSFTAKASKGKPTLSCSATVQGVKGFLQVNQLSVSSNLKTDIALILCDSEQSLQVFRKLGPPSELVRLKK